MKVTVRPGKPLLGTVTPDGAAALPGDKSLSHRAALLAALAQGESRIEHFLVSGVTQPLLAALTELGVTWELDGSRLRVVGQGLGGLKPPLKPLDCGNSATTMRLLAGALAAAGVAAVLDGSPGLRRRPMGRIVAPLQEMGVPIHSSAGETAPLALAARPAGQALAGRDYTLPVASAQVKTCLLLAALAAQGPTTLREPGPSRDHTERMLRAMGVKVTSRQLLVAGQDPIYETRLDPSEAPLVLLDLKLPGDMSAAAFLIVAAVITPGSHICLPGVGLNPTRTGLLEALRAMGADIQVSDQGEQGGEPVGTLTVRHSRLRGTQVGGGLVVRMIDEFPAFAAAAVYAEGPTTVSDAGELRHKESDRITALCAELRSLGAQVDETVDGFCIQGVGQAFRGGEVQPHGDHRLALALAAAGLAAAGPVTIHHAEIMAESFPNFPAVLQSLGADVETV